MFKAKLVITIITTVFLVTLSNSYSQEKETFNMVELSTNQQMKDHNVQSIPFKLHNSKPTQFDNTAIIEFELGEDANVILTVSDSKGKIVETLVNELMYAGVYNVNYKSSDKIITGELTYKLEIKSVSGIKNVFAVK